MGQRPLLEGVSRANYPHPDVNLQLRYVAFRSVESRSRWMGRLKSGTYLLNAEIRIIVFLAPASNALNINCESTGL